ncbi:YodC family protein [Salipiger thiooxidans]|uniref:YodC family protein n=1 Tax=Salipiger thiooxidans TaxID=282683 RepID=UPI001CD1EA7F|nr:DUF2158 domain-containing protein [Salipiger thiooxidans]
MHIEAGSVVTLKSGGPRMTVRWVKDGDAYCNWFEGAQEKGNRFAVVQLELQS